MLKGAIEKMSVNRLTLALLLLCISVAQSIPSIPKVNTIIQPTPKLPIQASPASRATTSPTKDQPKGQPIPTVPSPTVVKGALASRTKKQIPIKLSTVFEDMIAPTVLMAALNKLRSNPQSLIPYIQAQLNKFIDDKKIQLKSDFFYATQEGKKAWQEAIDFLRKQKPIPTLTYHNGLGLAACAHAIDLARIGEISHTGTDGSSMEDRVSRYNVYDSGQIGEDIAQGFMYDGLDRATEAMAQFTIDDGVADRGHRLSLFNDNFLFFGSSSKRSGDYIITVMQMASENLKETGVVPAGCDPKKVVTVAQPSQNKTAALKVVSSPSKTNPTNKTNGSASLSAQKQTDTETASKLGISIDGLPSTRKLNSYSNPEIQSTIPTNQNQPNLDRSVVVDQQAQQSGPYPKSPQPQYFYSPFSGVDSARYRKIMHPRFVLTTATPTAEKARTEDPPNSLRTDLTATKHIYSSQETVSLLRSQKP